MRVLCIGLDGRVGSAGSQGHAATWTREMARLVDEYVVLAEAPDGRASGAVRLSENATAYLMPGPRAAYSWTAARFAARLHAQRPFDICTTEDPVRSGLAGALFARWTGVPLNVENHSLHINEPVWLASRRRHHLYNRLARWVVRRADTIRNYSPDQNPALRGLGIPAHKMFVVPPPAPAENRINHLDARRELDIPPDERIVLSAGRMVPYKNVGTLLEAFGRLYAARPSRLLMAGDGPSRAAWRAQAARLGLERAVCWLDVVPETEMPLLYAAADVFVTTAVHETGPRTVLEALAAGCPVVVTPQMGVVHAGICSHGETALVAPPNDARRVAEAMDMLMEDPAWGRRMAREGRIRMEQQYSLRAVARSVAGIYRETVRRTHRLPLSSESENALPVA